MCSLLGIVGSGIQKQDLNILKQLGFISMLRGLDGTGFYQATIEGNRIVDFLFEKSELDASAFIRDLEHRKSRLLDDVHVDFVMGHTRWATIGDVKASNSHPFDLENIVAAHNGTLKEWKYWSKKRTDSELMFEEVNKAGLKPVLDELDKESAWAISLWDKNTHKLTFARNNHRTLSFALSNERDVLYWHSEMGALRYILGRNGVNAEYASFTPDKIFTVHPGEIKAKRLAMWDIQDVEKKPIFQISDWREGKKKKEPKKPAVKVIHIPRKVTEECMECKRVMYPIDIHQGLNIKNTYLCRQCIVKNPEHELVKKVVN